MGRSDEITRVIIRLASRQHGVVSRRQLLEQGLVSQTIEKRVARAGLFVIYPGVYATGTPLLTRDGILMASVMRAGEGAALGSRSAAAVWGFRPHQSPIEVLRQEGGSNQRARLRVHGERRWPYLLIHEARRLPPSEVTIYRGLSLTTPARTLLDLAAAVPEKQFNRAFTEADRLGLLNDQELVTCAERTQGRKGGGTFRRAVKRRIPGVSAAASLLEAIVLGLCNANQIPVPVTNEMLNGFRPDFRWPDQHVIVEADGYEYHRGQEMFENDLLRADLLREDGWDVLRFSWRMLDENPDRVARRIRKALSEK